MLYRLAGNIHDWSDNAKNIKTIKAETITKVKNLTGMLLDTPTSKGGNTNIGELFTLFMYIFLDIKKYYDCF